MHTLIRINISLAFGDSFRVRRCERSIFEVFETSLFLLLVAHTEVLVQTELLRISGGSSSTEFRKTLVRPLVYPPECTSVQLLDLHDYIDRRFHDLVVHHLLSIHLVDVGLFECHLSKIVLCFELDQFCPQISNFHGIG